MSRILALLLLVSCAHSVHHMHFSDYKPYEKLTSGKMIKADSEQFVIMGFTQDTSYVNEARKKLIGQCENGDIQGITTRYSTSLGFFSWTNKVHMEGLCI